MITKFWCRYLLEVGSEDGKLMELAQDRVQWLLAVYFLLTQVSFYDRWQQDELKELVGLLLLYALKFFFCQMFWKILP
jgi:hypothetical protein